jgi:hypothetical protein
VAIRTGPIPEKSRLIRLNATLLDARYIGEQDLEFSYESHARAIALFDRPIRSLQFDDLGRPGPSGMDWVTLPAGLHHVRASF